MRYFTGTTMECFESIRNEGTISINPPHRVWKEFSEDYVYFIPFDETDEDSRQEAFDFAAEQASFTIHMLNHDIRVVLEVEGLNESFLSEDPDSLGIGAVRYSQNVPISLVAAVHTEVGGDADKIKEFIALTQFTRMKSEKKLPPLDFELMFYDEDTESMEEYQQYISNQLNIPHLNLIDAYLFIDEDEMNHRYYDLYDEVEHEANFETKDISEFQLHQRMA